MDLIFMDMPALVNDFPFQVSIYLLVFLKYCPTHYSSLLFFLCESQGTFMGNNLVIFHLVTYIVFHFLWCIKKKIF